MPRIAYKGNKWNSLVRIAHVANRLILSHTKQISRNVATRCANYFFPVTFPLFASEVEHGSFPVDKETNEQKSYKRIAGTRGSLVDYKKVADC